MSSHILIRFQSSFVNTTVGLTGEGRNGPPLMLHRNPEREVMLGGQRMTF